MDRLDEHWRRTREGDHDSFAAWVRCVEMPLRRSLRSFARAVDVEGVVQEAMLRMWRLAPTLDLDGENASLRYAARIARNLALSEARRLKTVTDEELDRLERLPEGKVDPAPLPDPALARLIRQCLAALPRRPLQALQARLQRGSLDPDRDLARDLRMRLNTFLQNIVRARRFMAECLARHGVRLEEHLP